MLVELGAKLDRIIGIPDKQSPALVNHHAGAVGNADLLTGAHDDGGNARGDGINNHVHASGCGEVVNRKPVENISSRGIDAEKWPFAFGNFCEHSSEFLRSQTVISHQIATNCAID